MDLQQSPGLLLNRRVVRGGTEYLVRWRGHASPADACHCLAAGGGAATELENCHDLRLVAEYDAIAPNPAPRGPLCRSPARRWWAGR